MTQHTDLQPSEAAKQTALTIQTRPVANVAEIIQQAIDAEVARRTEGLVEALEQYAEPLNWGYYDDSGCFKGAGSYEDACVLGPNVANEALKNHRRNP